MALAPPPATSATSTHHHLPNFRPSPLRIPSSSLPPTTSASSSSPGNHTHFVGFNQDHSCFACGTATGFRIFNCDPFRETLRREFDGGSLFSYNHPRAESAAGEICIIEMLFKSNILAFVGGGRSPRYPPNKVMLWDDHQGRCIGELLFRSEVRGVRLRRDRIVVILEHKIYVYNFADLKLVHQLETLANPKSVCALSPASNSCVLACPGLQRGEVRLELFSNKKTRFVQAHTSSIACLSVCQSGSLLATASTKGTLVRIFNTSDGSKLREFRRGADRADIYSLAFSPDCHWLAVSSDKGTIHVFTLRSPWSIPEESREVDAFHMNSNVLGSLSSSISSRIQLARSSLLSLARANPGSSLSFIKGVLPKYFSSEWSFAQFHLPEETYAIVAFGAETNIVIVVCSNGSYYKCTFDPVHGGEMLQQEYAKFMKPDEENL